VGGLSSWEPAQGSSSQNRTSLAKSDHFGVQSTLDQFHDLLVWGLVCVIVVCFAVAVWSVYKTSRGRTRSLDGHRRVGE
jgi:hypothetical protein